MIRANEELIKLLVGGSILTNGELDKIEESLKNIKRIHSVLKENIEQVRQLDTARINFVEVVKKVEMAEV